MPSGCADLGWDHPGLQENWLLIADRNFYSFTDWQEAPWSGTQLLWRVKSDLIVPVLELLSDGSTR